MIDDFDDDDEEVWPSHSSNVWYIAIFVGGVAAAALLTYIFGGWL
ncbi:hypothetical protein [Phyllobacterium calauticae]|jgi:hypothetical protein|nr:hypothetical protein [Phyllobacterium calauticae]